MSIFHRQDKWDTDNFNDNFNESYPTYEEVAESVDAYIPADVFKPFTKKILNKMSEDDCRAMLQAVFDAISKDGSTIKLSPSVETAIIAIMVDKAS